jgi:uncharacterized protein (DUF58 family)
VGAYVELQTLINLQYKAKGFSFFPRQPIHSLLSGRNSSRLRGRGLDFEELRAYLPGDDIRTMDWHVTARMQKPFVRVFTEERDRPALIVLDQRLNMFFGSRVSTKSVTAAEIAALAAWRVFHQGDRVGALIFNDSLVEEIKPLRSRATVMRILEKSVEQNRRLSAGSEDPVNSAMLNEILRRISRVAQHDFTILLISDFDGADPVTDNLLLDISQHNDVLAVFVYDPLAAKLPSSGELVVSNGELQVELQFGREHIRKALLDASDKRIRHILSWQKKLDIPVLPVNTAEETGMQVRHLLGQAVARTRHA